LSGRTLHSKSLLLVGHLALYNFYIRTSDRLTCSLVGNHDLSLDRNYDIKHPEGWTVPPERALECRELMSNTSTITYLQHESATLRVPGTNTDIRVFGSPHSPDRGKQNWAFQYPPERARSQWDAIPTQAVDVVITHTPLSGHRDASEHWREGGCPALRAALWRARPLLHVCGHCHEGRGAEVVRCSDDVESEVESVRS